MVESTGDKRKPPNAGKGRKKGVPNRVTRAAKDAIAMAAEELGGYKRMVDWAKEDPVNERVFWGTIYPKLIPVTLEGDPNNPIGVAVTVKYVSAD